MSNRKEKNTVVLPGIARALRELGQDISQARRARRIQTTDMAERMGCSRGTLNRLESGDPGVSINTFARALMVLGMLDRLSTLVAPEKDDIGMVMQQKSLPQRVSRPRRKPTADPYYAGTDVDPAEVEEDDYDMPRGW